MFKNFVIDGSDLPIPLHSGLYSWQSNMAA